MFVSTFDLTESQERQEIGANEFTFDSEPGERSDERENRGMRERREIERKQKRSDERKSDVEGRRENKISYDHSCTDFMTPPFFSFSLLVFSSFFFSSLLTRRFTFNIIRDSIWEEE